MRCTGVMEIAIEQRIVDERRSMLAVSAPR
jgi:hypothetical protein